MKKVLIVLSLLIIISLDVSAGSFTDNMSVSPIYSELYKVRNVGGSIPLTVKLDETTENRNNRYVQYRVINFHDENPVSDWVRVLEGGVQKNANFADSWGFNQCYSGDQIFIHWKNSTNWVWVQYTVHGTVNYY